MNVENFLPFLLIVAPFVLAFFLEGLVIYFFKLKSFWASIGLSFLINLLSMGMLYIAGTLLTKLGYAFDSLNFPVQVILAFWWLSVVFDGALLRLFTRAEKRPVYLSALIMNSISYTALTLFIANSH